ncbi:MAG: S1 RNA-binding domain-containing protein, partial [Deltaproteobacteria bacterium]|nr:S1 RNA-binding domain-containing protein [Deltaproteobacteria bacterium]
DDTAAKQAIEMIKTLTEEAEVGKIYQGSVVKVMDFGAFVRIMPGVEGLVHISELTDTRVRRVEDVVQEGDEVLVKVIQIEKNGKIRLSRREALKDSNGKNSGRSPGNNLS